MAHVETVHGGRSCRISRYACLPASPGEIKLPAADVRLENNAITIEPDVSKVNMRR
ncbi:hypothetical protein OH491_22040 [Termitidicoccus mucosus]|uniref:hypothetical protein n=1 Tax=Termitidicoccus mucosus TaxID=1184151 RepID=UPI0031841A0F